MGTIGSLFGRNQTRRQPSIVSCSSPRGTLSRQLTRRFLELWLRNLIPHWQRSPRCIQLCGSCLWSGRAPAVCSNISSTAVFSATALAMDKSRQDFFTVYIDGFSQAELVHISELASAAEVPSSTAAVHAAWNNRRIPKQFGRRN